MVTVDGGRMNERERVEELVERIGPMLADHPPITTGAVLSMLCANFIASLAAPQRTKAQQILYRMIDEAVNLLEDGGVSDPRRGYH